MRLIGPFRGGRVLAVAGVPERAAAFLFRRGQRRRLADRGCRPHLAADLRRPRHRLDRRDRGRAVGRRTSSTSAAAKPTCARTSRKATACTAPRRRQDLERTSASPTASRSRKIIVDPHDPEHRLRRRARSSLRTERRTRRVPLARRRRVVAARARQRRRNRRDRSRVRARQSARDLRGDVADAAHAVEHYPPANGPGSGLYKSTDGGDTWTPLTRQRISRQGRPHRHRCRASKSETRLRDRRQPGARRRRRRPLSIRRCRRELEAHQQRRPHLATRLVFRPHRGRSEERRSHLRHEHDRAALGRRRRAFHRAEGRPDRRRFPRDVDRSRQCRSPDPRRRSGRDHHVERRQDLELMAEPADRADLSRQHRQPFSVPRLRRAAGFRRCRAAEPHRRVDGITMREFHEITAGGEAT